MPKEIKHVLKVLLLGDGAVGKTSLILRFIENKFKDDYQMSLGANFLTKTVKFIDTQDVQRNVSLQVWDIAGQDNFHFLRRSFFKNSRAAIIVYSLEENKLGEESFSHISDWHKDIIKYCGDVPIVVFANKVDLVNKDKIGETEIQDTVRKYNFFDYYITSAKTGENVIQAFNAIIEKLYFKYKPL